MTARQHTLPRRDYPTGVPIQPPPGWQPRVPPSAPRPRRRPSTSQFRAQITFVLRALLLSLLVIVCMGIGWFLVNGRRPSRGSDNSAVAKVGPKKGKGETELKKHPGTSQANPPADNTDPAQIGPPDRSLTYEKDILPIMERACISCHGTFKKRGKLDLRTYQALLRGGESGTGVVPGKPEASPLWTEIKSGSMPPRSSKKKLSPEDKELVRNWIASGAKSR